MQNIETFETNEPMANKMDKKISKRFGFSKNACYILNNFFAGVLERSSHF